eukprot:Anaeramoba_ignava/a481106_7.p1 GENE.a481106_7~~a481106_7.p1  ORF type:complete len:381 (+),score=121.82 a481106_7:40-1143(+)
MKKENERKKQEEKKETDSVVKNFLSQFIPSAQKQKSVQEHLGIWKANSNGKIKDFSLQSVLLAGIAFIDHQAIEEQEFSDYSDLSFYEDDEILSDQPRHTSLDLSTVSYPISPIFSSHSKQIPILKINPSEFCKQLTLKTFNLFKNIKIHEFFFARWTKKNIEKQGKDANLAKNVISMIENFNNIADWVSLSVLKEPQLEKRVKILSVFIKMGYYLYTIGDYHDMVAVVSGLQCSSVYRLTNTWKNLPQKSSQNFQFLDQFASADHFKSLRDSYRKASSATIPYLGVYLSDFTLLDEISPRLKNNLINFVKQRRFYTCYLQIRKFQKTPFNFPFNESIHKIVSAIPTEKVDQQVFWDLSSKIEPLNF